MRSTVLLFALSIGVSATSARAESIETLPMPAAKSAETAMVSSGGTGWLAVSFGANDTYRYRTDGTAPGTTKVSTLGQQRVRFLGLLGAAPFFIERSLASDALCTSNATDVSTCASPAAVTEPEAPSLFKYATRYPNIAAAFVVDGSALYTSTGAFTNGMIGGDRKLGHVGVFTPPTATSVHVLSPGDESSPTRATVLGVAGGKGLFQRSDDASKVYVLDGMAVTSRASPSASSLSYVASPRGAARVLARGALLYGMSAAADEDLGAVNGVTYAHMFGARVALMVALPEGVALWITDGTVAGTTKLSFPSTYTTAYHLMATSDRLYAMLSDGSRMSLWTTNGVVAPTRITTYAIGESANLIGARGDTAYVAVTPIEGTEATVYKTSGGEPVSVGSVAGRVQRFSNVVDGVDRSATVGGAVVAYLQSGGLMFIRDVVAADAGADADATVEDAMTDTADDAPVVDTSVSDTSTSDPDTRVDETSAPVEDAGATADTTSDGGCGCRTSPRTSTPAWLFVALAALLARRQRSSR